MKKKLAKNTIIISIGKICTQLISILLLPLYTSILTPEEYGITDIITILILLVVPVLTLQIEQGAYRELIEIRDNNEEKIKIISNTTFSTFMQIILYCCLFLFISFFIDNEYKCFLLFNTIAYILNSILLQITRGLGFNIKYSIGSFICAISTIIFNIVFLVYLKLGVYGILFGNLLGYICSCLYLIISIKLWKYLKLKYISKEIIFKILKYSIPLVPNAICWWIFSASDRMIVNMYLGVSSVGILAASLKFSNIIASSYSIFHISWIESVSLNIKSEEGKKFFNEMFDLIFFLFCSLSILIISLMPFIFELLIDEKYAFGYNFVPISIVSVLANIFVSLITAVYYGFKDTKSIAKTSFYAAVLNIIVHVVLIRYIGLYAAPISTLIAYLVISFFRYIDIKKKYLPININIKKFLNTIVVCGIVIILYYTKNKIYINLSVTLATIYFYIINKQNIIKLFRFLFKKEEYNEK